MLIILVLIKSILFSFVNKDVWIGSTGLIKLTELEPPLILRPNFCAICAEVGIVTVNKVVGVVGEAIAINKLGCKSDVVKSRLFGKFLDGGVDWAGDANCLFVDFSIVVVVKTVEIVSTLFNLIELLKSGELANLSL